MLSSTDVQPSSLTISVLFLTSTFCSALASLITCIVYFIFGKLAKSYPGRLVFIIAICDFFVWFDRFLNITAKLITGSSVEDLDEFYCLFSAILCCFFGILNISATFLIVFSIFMEIVFLINPNKYEKTGYVLSVVFSVILSLIPLILHDYGHLDEYQCWITNKATNFFIFYLPILLVFTADFLFIAYILYYLNKMKKFMAISALCKKLLMFPTILLISWTPGLIRSITDCHSQVLLGFMYFFMPLQGVFNPVIYGSMFSVLKGKNIEKKTEKHKEEGTVVTLEDELNEGDTTFPKSINGQV